MASLADERYGVILTGLRDAFICILLIGTSFFNSNSTHSGLPSGSFSSDDQNLEDLDASVKNACNAGVYAVGYDQSMTDSPP